MRMEKIVLLGAGGHAYSVIDSIISNQNFEIVGITDSEYPQKPSILNCKIIGEDSILPKLFASGVKNAFVTVGTIGNTALKEKLSFLLKEIGFMQPIIADISAVIGNETKIAEGVYIGKKTVLNASCIIGAHVIINTGAIIEHNCQINNFTHIAPGAIVCGDVRIGSHTHIGANSVIIQGCSIGNHCLIGAGSVVTSDLPDHVIAYGNPCKVVRNNG